MYQTTLLTGVSEQYLDSFARNFDDLDEMYDFHQTWDDNTKWKRVDIRDLNVVPFTLETVDSLTSMEGIFADSTTFAAIDDTVRHLGLGLSVENKLYPLGDTAFASLLDRCKISGSVLGRMPRKVLSDTLNECLKLQRGKALLLIRDQKIRAVHSGDKRDYSVLASNWLLDSMCEFLSVNFPGNTFVNGYADHSRTTARWRLDGQTKQLLHTYQKHLEESGISATDVVPGIRFGTSDTGFASASVSAYLHGLSETPIPIGSCLLVKHRSEATVEDFSKKLSGLFAQYSRVLDRLEQLMDVELDYPVNAMVDVAKTLGLPRKATSAAIAVYKDRIGDESDTAHNVYLAMQEILWNLQCDDASQSTVLKAEENLARALNINWKDHDLAFLPTKS